MTQNPEDTPSPPASDPDDPIAEDAADLEAAPASDEPEEPKKERVLHTRIPAVLEQELKAAARSLRIPVSNLVRTILEDAVAIADRASERVEDRLSKAAKTVHNERGRLRDKVKRAPLEGVVAYQPVVMAAEGECAKCGATLDEGDDAGLAVTNVPGTPRFVCLSCLPKR